MPIIDVALAGYIGLFINAFLAATLLPAFSEVTVVAMAQGTRFDPMTVWVVATAGNTLGSCVNWVLGRYLLQFQERRWFPISAKQLERASAWYSRYGLWSLLFAWLPVVGDPLTFVAGVLRARFWAFLLLVAIGKGGRYAAALALTETIIR